MKNIDIDFRFITYANKKLQILQNQKSRFHSTMLIILLILSQKLWVMDKSFYELCSTLLSF